MITHIESGFAGPRVGAIKMNKAPRLAENIDRREIAPVAGVARTRGARSRLSTDLFQLDSAEDADVAAEVAIVPVATHVLAEVDLGRAVGTADGAADARLGGGASGVGSQVPLEGFLDRTGVRTQGAAVFLPLVPANRRGCAMVPLRGRIYCLMYAEFILGIT